MTAVVAPRREARDGRRRQLILAVLAAFFVCFAFSCLFGGVGQGLVGGFVRIRDFVRLRWMGWLGRLVLLREEGAGGKERNED
jgi:hypothetical protein